MMKLFIATMLAAALAAAGAAAQPKIVLPYATDTTLKTERLILLEEFAAKLDIGSLERPRFATSLGVGKLVAAFKGTSVLKGQITHTVLDKETGMVLGVVGGRLTFTGTLPNGAVKVLVTDGKGSVLSNRQIVGVNPATGTRICMKQTPVTHLSQRGGQMAFVILLDRSGSMHDVMPDVKHAVDKLLRLLPDNAHCRVIAFNGAWSDLGAGGWHQCKASQIDMSGLTAEGGTDIYTPLSDAYRTLRALQDRGWQTAAFLVTDGQLNDDARLADQRRQQLVRQKDKAFTTVFWHGNHTGARKNFVGLADAYIESGGDLKGLLPKSFGLVGEQYRAQVVLTPTSCPGGKR